MASAYNYLTSENSVTDNLIIYRRRWKEPLIFIYINLEYKDHRGGFMTENTNPLQYAFNVWSAVCQQDL